jgi:hypothetical protein
LRATKSAEASKLSNENKIKTKGSSLIITI